MNLVINLLEDQTLQKEVTKLKIKDMAYDNKGGVNNALKYFNDGGEYNKPLKKAQFNNSVIVPMTMTTSSHGLSDTEKLKQHDEKAKRQLALRAGKHAVIKETKKGDKTVYKKPKKIKLNTYN